MVVSTRQLLDDDIEGKRVWDVVGHLFHFFVPLCLKVLCESQLAELVVAPREKFCVFWTLTVLICID